MHIIDKPFTFVKAVSFAELTFTWMLTIFFFSCGLSFRNLSDAVILTAVLRQA